MNSVTPHHVIAIGASAGGIEEIHKFFDYTPLDGVCYVIVQHLSQEFKSRMKELLAKHSKLLVVEAVQDMVVQSNMVYLIPNNMFMTIKNGQLDLVAKKEFPTPHLTINAFFESLASDAGVKAIGIILSGLGSDGTEGIRAIKYAGGMVMARKPESTEFSSMPSSAIATGLVDFVLEPEAMPHAIEDYIRYERAMLSDTKDDAANLATIVGLIKEKLPFDFSDYKQSTILRRTKRRAASSNCESLGAYLHFLKTSTAEIEALSKEFLISVSSFFRDPEAFDVIEQVILPNVLKGIGNGEELKIWVAGCATGEEVYSLAILIAEQLVDAHKDTVVKIFATDLDEAALLYAGRGRYPQAIAHNLTPKRLAKYFSREGDGFQILPEVRKMVIFARHDLVKNAPYCNMHLISCRNLLIYLTPVLQKKILDMFLFGLKTSGYLFLGSSENPQTVMSKLEVINKKWKIYKSQETKQAVSFDAFSLPDIRKIEHTSTNRTRNILSKDAFSVLDETIHNTIAAQIGYLVLCVDERSQVVRSYGDTKYLLRKHFTTDLLELLSKPLAVAFNMLRSSVPKSETTASDKGIKVKSAGHILLVDLSVTALPVQEGVQPFFMIAFTETKSEKQLGESKTVLEEKVYLDRYTTNLEDEVKNLKRRLEGVYEQLDSTNENMQSFNEDLLSANEEMQSTNEEMQSVNEELHTINTDYQLKNKELTEINDDLNNYFRSNINGQLFVDKELRLVKFSPGTVKQINLLESDIGRPISNITTNIKFETISSDIKQVIDHGNVITKEIETNNGKWYQVMTMPYVMKAGNKNNGAIITFNDITQLKRAQQELDNSNKMLVMATDSAGIGTWTIDIHNRAYSASPRARQILGFGEDEAITYEETLLHITEPYRSQVSDMLEKTIKRGIKYQAEYQLKRANDGIIRWVKAVGNLTYNHEGHIYFSGLLHDITEEKIDGLRKNDFVAMVSHELRNPLTVMQGYVHLLSMPSSNGNVNFSAKATEKISIQIKKMSLLIDGFLNTANLESGKIKLDKHMFKLDVLMKEVVEEIAVTTQNHDILIHTCQTLIVNADRVKIGQVISNLLNNAIKYSANGKKIEVSCKEFKGSVRIGIKDEGIGIEKQDQEKVFDRFFRVENANYKPALGFGLGLYLSSEVIKLHHGKIWVESEMGKGSTFYFKIPLLDQQLYGIV